MKKSIKFLVVPMVGLLLFTASCKKCEECHYDGPNDEEVEIGELCDDELEDAEANGYVVDGTTYEVHCGEGH
jgi:Zn-dependent alcohol dehydrogenase